MESAPKVGSLRIGGVRDSDVRTVWKQRVHIFSILMTKINLKIILLAAPLLAIAFLEAVVLPKDYFTYRSWEALMVNFFFENLPGPFYPSTKMTKWEALDRNPRGPRVRQNEWFTDMYGNRNRTLPSLGQKYGVLTGDSNIAGASFSQNEIFSERLTAKTGFSWINLNYEYFEPWEHPLCRSQKPAVIVYELKRGYLLQLSKMGVRTVDPMPGKREVAVNLDHATKLSALNWARATFGMSAVNLRDQFLDPHLDLFRQGLGRGLFGGVQKRPGNVYAFKNSPAVSTLIEYTHKCEDLGIFFIILVLPDTVREADPLIQELVSAGCHVIGFLPNDQYQDGADLESFWQKDDSHWAIQGMEESANEVAKLLPE